MQPFFQQSLTDGTPLWIVAIKDVVLPTLTILGGAFAFFAWNRRKKKEHRLMHQTKAYEIILEKEIQCYGEIQNAVYESTKAAMVIADKVEPFVFGRESVIYENCVADIRKQEEIIRMLYRNTVLLIDKSIAELLLEFQINYMNAGNNMNSCISGALASNKDEMLSNAGELRNRLLNTEIKASIIASSIKEHLEEISRIK